MPTPERNFFRHHINPARQNQSLIFRFVTAQTGIADTIILQSLQGQPVNLTEGKIVNKNQVKGIAKDVAGKVQEKVGQLVGSKEQQVKGLGKQIAGKAEKKYGDAKEVIKDAKKRY